jgi:uncharacterized protein
VEGPISIPADVARKLGYYVYVLVNPLDGRIFYVGKGRNKRALSHLQDTGRSRKFALLRQIRSAGKAAQIDILAHGLKSADAAFRIEAAAIDVLGLPALTNKVRGFGASRFGRLPLSEVTALYRRKRVTIREPAILIRINELYRGGMNETELYDATRGIWKVGEQREKVKFAFAVFEGVIREVYEISHWLRAGSTLSTRNPRGLRSSNRWEFVGRLAAESMRKRYVNRYIGYQFTRGNQNPIRYINL